MKYIFILLTLLMASSLYAADEGSGTTSTGGTFLPPTEVKELTLWEVQVEDDMHLVLSFSSPVELITTKLKITKQSDNSSLKITSITPVENDEMSVRVNLESPLVESSAYTLTIISAVGTDGSVIRDGALALRDFITPVPLKKYEETLNAPTNPNAVMVTTGSTTENEMTITPVEPVKTQSPIVEGAATGNTTATPPKELPMTGMNTLYLLAIILPIAFLFMRRKA